MGSPAGPRAGARAGGLDLHERDEAVDLGLGRDELCQHAAEAERVLAERGAHPVLAGGRGVAFVEDEVDDLEDGGEARGELGPAGHFEGDARLGERALGADDALGDGRLRDEEGARDLGGGEAAEQAQRERDARLGREDRVAGGKHEAEEIVAHLLVDGAGRGPARRSCSASRARPSSSWWRSRTLPRRRTSMARRFAVAISQAPGLSGMPTSGQRSSAATSASWASSSARPTSRTIRARPAMSRGDSMRQRASMVRWMSPVTAPDQSIIPAARPRSGAASPPWPGARPSGPRGRARRTRRPGGSPAGPRRRRARASSRRWPLPST